MSDELLRRVLELAEREGALAGERLPDFGRGLAARAERIVQERVDPLAERAASYEKEAAWQRETLAACDRERAWLEERLEASEKELAWVKQTLVARDEELAWLKESLAAREEELVRLNERLEHELRPQGSDSAATAAHDRLLAHHHELLRKLIDALEAFGPELPFWRRDARARLAGLVETLRRELP